MKLFVQCISITLLLFACKKVNNGDPILVENPGIPYYDCNCPSLQTENEDYIIDIQHLMEREDQTTYGLLQVNPNDPNEISYGTSNENSTSKYIRYNLLTQQKQTILEDFKINNLTWGKKDWILFTDTYNMFKIKSNGDSLSVFGDHTWLNPKWNAAGDKFVVSLKFQSHREIKNIEGETIKTISNPGWNLKYYTWSHPEYFVTYDHKNIKIIDLDNNKLIKHIKAPFVNQTTQLSLFHQVSWKSETELIITRTGAIYTYNIETEEIKHISCDCRWNTSFITHASDFSLLLLNKNFIRHNEDSTKYLVDLKLFLVNPHTLQDFEITP